MPKEHWATKLKREKAELEQENAQLKEANDRLASELEAAASNPAPAPEAPKNEDGIQPRPIGMNIYTCDERVNWVRETDPNWIPPLEEDEVELRVETAADKQKYCPITGVDSFVDGRPLPSWEKAISGTRRYIKEGKLDGKRVTVFDPYGFFDQFKDQINIVKTHREHEECRTDEWMRRREEEEIARQNEITFPKSYWRLRNVSMRDIFIDGESFFDAFYGENDKLKRARVYKKYKSAFYAEYVNSEPPHEQEVYGFQMVGDIGETLDTFEFSVACNPGQQVIVHFHGVLPDSLPMQFFEEEADQEGVYSPGNPEGATISFMDNR